MILEELQEMNPDALVADGLEAGLVGYTLNHHHPVVAVYDFAKCVSILRERDGMTEEEAEEFLHFNTLGAFVGDSGPLFIHFGDSNERRHSQSETAGPVGEYPGQA